MQYHFKMVQYLFNLMQCLFKWVNQCWHQTPVICSPEWLNESLEILGTSKSIFFWKHIYTWQIQVKALRRYPKGGGAGALTLGIGSITYNLSGKFFCTPSQPKYFQIWCNIIPRWCKIFSSEPSKLTQDFCYLQLRVAKQITVDFLHVNCNIISRLCNFFQLHAVSFQYVVPIYL